MTKRTKYVIRGSLIKIVQLILMISCVSRLDKYPGIQNNTPIVVDGLITDEPGPHQVKIFRINDVNSNLLATIPISVTEISIIDDFGVIENLIAKEPGIYETRQEFKGDIGRIYTLKFTDIEGNKFESLPEKILPSGKIDTLYYTFTSFLPLKGPTEYGFKLFADSEVGSDEESYYRLRYEGTYKIETYPMQRKISNQGSQILDPPPCTFGLDKSPPTNRCECCTCWITEYENKPVVKASAAISNGKFRGTEVGYVPITGFTFYDKFRIEIKQMSISQNAFSFWESLQKQKEGASSLFQPPGGKPKGNIISVNNNLNVDGLFYAASVNTKVTYISSFEARQYVNFQAPDSVKDDCRKFRFSTATKPSFWVD